jgi:hypothetical protein
MKRFKCSSLIEQKLSDDKTDIELTGLIDYALVNEFIDIVFLMDKEDIEKFKKFEADIYKRNNIVL